MSRKRFFTRDLCTDTRLRASLSPSLASSTSRTQGARRGNGRCILPPLTAWVLFRGRSFLSPNFINRHLSSILRRVTFGEKKNVSLLHFCTKKNFFTTFLYQKRFLYVTRIENPQISLPHFCTILFSQPICSSAKFDYDLSHPLHRV